MHSMGVLGCGVISQFLLDGIRRAGCGLAGVCDLDAALAAKAAETWDTEVFPDYEAMLADPGVAAIVVALPSNAHYEAVCQALSAGKHVFCEKPLATKPAESLDLQRRAAAAGLVLQTGYMKRFHPAYGGLKPLAETIGPLYGASVQLTLNGLGWTPAEQPQAPGGDWRWDLKRAGGGFLTHSGSHLLDLIQYLFGTPTRAFGRVLIDGSGNEYNTNVLLTCGDGLPVHLDLRYVAIEAGSSKQTPWDERVEIVGQRGRARAEGYDWQGQTPCRLFVETPEKALEETEHDSTEQWVGEFAAFERAMSGEATIASTGVDGYHVDVMLHQLRGLGPVPNEVSFAYEA